MKVLKNKLREHVKETHPIFYTLTYNSQGNEKWIFSPSAACRRLEEKGFGIENGFLVRVTDSIVESVAKEDAYRELLEEVKQCDDQTLEDDFIKNGERFFLKDRGALLSLKQLDKKLARDSKNQTHHFYRDGAILVTEDEFIKIEYSDLDGLVRSEWIINRSMPNLDRIGVSVACKFIGKITFDEAQKLTLECLAGYLMSNHKDSSNAKMGLLTASNPREGGAGKDLFRKMIEQHVPTCVIDGKRVDPEKDKFWNQNHKNQPILYIADMENPNIRPYFHCITDAMEKEIKYRDKVVIPFEDSPKLLGSANSEYIETNAAYRRRSFIVRLTNYYNDRHTPIDDFGQVFFDDWDQGEWELFDLYMMECSQKFLKHGLIEYDNEEFKLKSAINKTSQEFWQCMTEGGFGKIDTLHLKNELRYALTELNPYYRNISHKKLKTWLEVFAEFHGYTIEEQRGTDGFAGYTLLGDDLM